MSNPVFTAGQAVTVYETPFIRAQVEHHGAGYAGRPGVIERVMPSEPDLAVYPTVTVGVPDHFEPLHHSGIASNVRYEVTLTDGLQPGTVIATTDVLLAVGR